MPIPPFLSSDKIHTQPHASSPRQGGIGDFGSSDRLHDRGSKHMRRSQAVNGSSGNKLSFRLAKLRTGTNLNPILNQFQADLVRQPGMEMGAIAMQDGVYRDGKILATRSCGLATHGMRKMLRGR